MYKRQRDDVVYAEVQAARCLLYTSDAADEARSVDLGGRRIIIIQAFNDAVSYTHLTLPTKLEV
ncbi:hypothetical protein JMUB7547_28120 [Staphylococcus aureus]